MNQNQYAMTPVDTGSNTTYIARKRFGPTVSIISWEQQIQLAKGQFEWLIQSTSQSGPCLVACLFQPRLGDAGGAIAYSSTIPNGVQSSNLRHEGRVHARAWYRANGSRSSHYHAEDGACYLFETDPASNGFVVSGRYIPDPQDGGGNPMTMVVYGRLSGDEAPGVVDLCHGNSRSKPPPYPSCQDVCNELGIVYIGKEANGGGGGYGGNGGNGGNGGGGGGRGRGTGGSSGGVSGYQTTMNTYNQQNPSSSYSVNNTTVGSFSQPGPSNTGTQDTKEYHVDKSTGKYYWYDTVTGETGWVNDESNAGGSYGGGNYTTTPGPASRNDRSRSRPRGSSSREADRLADQLGKVSISSSSKHHRSHHRSSEEPRHHSSSSSHHKSSHTRSSGEPRHHSSTSSSQKPSSSSTTKKSSSSSSTKKPSSSSSSTKKSSSSSKKNIFGL